MTRRSGRAFAKVLTTRAATALSEVGLSSNFWRFPLVIAPNFCEEPAVARYLRTPNANMEAKLDLLTNLVCARLRNLE